MNMKKIRFFNGKILICILSALFLMCAVVLLCPQTSAANAASKEIFSYYGIKVNAAVREDKTIEIVERLTVKFVEKGQTSMCRSIMRTFASRSDKNSVFPVKEFVAEISGMSATVNGSPAEVKSDISPDGSYHFVYINTEQAFSTEETSEVIFSYIYDMSNDVTAGYGELLFPMFNDRFYWLKKNTRYTLDMTFPEGWSIDGIKTALIDESGEWKPSEEDSISIDGNKISASFIMTERVMLTAELPKGLFVVPYHSEYWFFYGLVIALALVGIAVTYKYRGRTPLHTVEYTPPDVNPLYFSTYWHGYARKRDVSTLILQWAHIGCVKLKKDGKSHIFIEKLKPLPQNRLDEEKEYFDALFACGKVYSSRKMKERRNFWHRHRISRAMYGLMEKADNAVTYAHGVEKARAAVPVLGYLSVAVFMSYFAIVSGNIGFMIIGIFCSVFGACCVGALYNFGILMKISRGVLLARIIIFFGAYGCFAPLIAVFAFAFMLYNPVFDYAFLIVLCLLWLVTGMAVLPKFISKRTEEAQKLYGKMLGFKKFISTVEVPRLELMMNETPEYYYDILPYVMMMGLSKKVDKKFSNLANAVPEWAEGFSSDKFASSLFASVKSAARVSTGKKGKEDK